jgi:hypothetical protein
MEIIAFGFKKPPSNQSCVISINTILFFFSLDLKHPLIIYGNRSS